MLFVLVVWLLFYQKIPKPIDHQRPGSGQVTDLLELPSECHGARYGGVDRLIGDYLYWKIKWEDCKSADLYIPCTELDSLRKYSWQQLVNQKGPALQQLQQGLDSLRTVPEACIPQVMWTSDNLYGRGGPGILPLPKLYETIVEHLQSPNFATPCHFRELVMDQPNTQVW